MVIWLWWSMSLNQLFCLPMVEGLSSNQASRLKNFFQAQLRLKFILLINVKMPTIVGFLTFISRINYRLLSSKPSISIYMYLGYFCVYEQLKFQAQLG